MTAASRLVAMLSGLILAQAVGAIAMADGARPGHVCASIPDLVGPCFELRGRLSFWNGAPSARIWPVGTKRLLGVHDDVLPPALEAALAAFAPEGRFDTEVWADFRLCPMTRARTGRMQFVCIDAWRRASFRHRKG